MIDPTHLIKHIRKFIIHCNGSERSFVCGVIHKIRTLLRGDDQLKTYFGITACFYIGAHITKAYLGGKGSRI